MNRCRVLVRVTKADYAAVKACATSDGKNVSELIRAAVAEYSAHRGCPVVFESSSHSKPGSLSAQGRANIIEGQRRRWARERRSA